MRVPFLTRTKPFAGYEDFDACVKANQDKEDPDAYCASIMQRVEKATSDPDIDRIEHIVNSASFRKEYERTLAEAVTPIFREVILAGLATGEKLMRGISTKAAGEAAAESAFVGVDLEALADDIIRSFVPTFTDAISEVTYSHIAAAAIRARAEGTGVFGVLETTNSMFSAERATSIAVTETTRLFGMANQAVYKALGAEQWEWQTVRDAFVCPICEGLNGEQYDIDFAFGPAHPRCLVEGTLVAGVASEAIYVSVATRRVYEGDVIRLCTTRGDQLTVTPNHPILTSRGWVAADLLKEGDDVICDRLVESFSPLIDPDDEQLPAVVEQVWEALSVKQSVVRRVMPSTAEQFHGDGSTDGDVDVVLVDGFPWCDAHSPLRQPQRELALVIAAKSTLHGVSTKKLLLDGRDPSTRRSMGSFNLLRSAFRRPRRSLNSLSFGVVSDDDISVQESSSDYHATNSESLCESVLGLTSYVAPNEIDLVKLLTVMGDAVSLSVVTRLPYRGHVYNLQTSTGWYIADGIVTHNCRCFPRPAEM